MDKSERARLKQLANDAIIATFGQDTSEARLAQALEQAVDDLDYHGDCIGPRTEEDEVDPVDVEHLRNIYTQLRERADEIDKAVVAIENATWKGLSDEVDDLKEAVKELRTDLDELNDEL